MGDTSVLVSEENLDLVRRAYEVMDNDVEAFLELCDPDVTFVNPDDAVEPGVRHGYGGVRKWFAALHESYEWRGHPPLRMVAVGDRVVVEQQATMSGHGTGLSIETRFGHIWTLRDGKVLSWQWFRQPDQAFRAAGLDPNVTDL
jgi:ketosteroid isomerase-like protein